MSIKSDRWIRRMAAEHGMIEPFSAGQVRVSEGHKIVSYGTSSYGYDVRCADDFKIFTNINSTIVDPKNFDEKSFVDFKGPVCIIPPNSFALASTVEYFRIPRSVLTVCLGKCVTGDTRVVHADTGAYLPITEMRWGKSTLAWNGRRLEHAKVSAFIPQGQREVFELRTAAGLKIRATSNHPFLTVEKWTALRELHIGDRIAVAHDIPVVGKTPIPDWEASLLAVMIGERPGMALDPVVVRLSEDAASVAGSAEVERLQQNLAVTEKSVPQSIFTAPEASVRLFLQALLSCDSSVQRSTADVVVEYHAASRRLVEDIHHLLLRFGIFSLIREKTTPLGLPACTIEITDKDQIRRFAERVGFLAGSARQRVFEEEVLPIPAAESLGVTADVGGGHSASTSMARSNDAISARVQPVWDTVEQIESRGMEHVFDITVPGLHNFLANDLIVHNSTYARCFSGDTRVALVDGSSPTLEEMARRHDSGEVFWGYSISEHGRLIVALLDAPRYIGRDPLLEVELDSGDRVLTTPEHLFMRRDGRMTEANHLRPGDALMPLHRDLIGGCESVYQPFDGYMYPTHRLAERCDRSLTATYRNHKVSAVRAISGDHDVFCLTVPAAGNFALEAGIFVKNCGIIVNVTPLEPEWEGHVTLEFSNTTPLPAKIYANEGVAQMLFFESDEVCETSYADRGGKYQGQRGVTLPKT